MSAFETLGYSRCGGGVVDFEQVERIAIFADAKGPTHAARQSPSGMWTSKLGKGVDIDHTLEGLEGGVYGGVACADVPRPADLTAGQ